MRLRMAALGAVAALILAGCGNAGEQDANPIDNQVDENAASKFEAGTTMSDLAKAGKVKIGVKFDQPGLGFKRAGENTPAGFDVEIGKILAAKLGITGNEVQWVETISDNREPLIMTVEWWSTADGIIKKLHLDVKQSCEGYPQLHDKTWSFQLVSRAQQPGDLFEVPAGFAPYGMGKVRQQLLAGAQ